MGFGQAVSTCFSKYATFSGRAPRSEYWFFYLFYVIASVVLTVLDMMIFGIDNPYSPLSSIFSLAVLLPYLAVTARRFHDIGRSGWWILWFILIMFGGVILGLLLMMISEVLGGLVMAAAVLGVMIVQIVWLASKGTMGDNAYGVDPLAAPAAPETSPPEA